MAVASRHFPRSHLSDAKRCNQYAPVTIGGTVDGRLYVCLAKLKGQDLF